MEKRGGKIFIKKLWKPPLEIFKTSDFICEDVLKDLKRRNQKIKKIF